MRIIPIAPKPPPPSFELTIDREEAITLIAALNHYIRNHPNAYHINRWKQMLADLEQGITYGRH